MMDSDYVLCSRGFGNYSYRLYESLACGRIPVFVDTDCVLPYDFVIDWKRYCVWVDQSDLDSIPDRVAEFHDDLSPQQFEDLQLECRRLWEKWLAPEGFFAVGVKAATEHRDAYEPIAAAGYVLDLPGPCAANLGRLPFRSVRRPIYPLDGL